MENSKLEIPPSLRSAMEAENFVANVDLSKDDLSGFHRVAFEFQPPSPESDRQLPGQFPGSLHDKAATTFHHMAVERN